MTLRTSNVDATTGGAKQSEIDSKAKHNHTKPDRSSKLVELDQAKI